MTVADHFAMLSGLALMFAVVAGGGIVYGRDGAPAEFDPRQFGLDIPPGPLCPGADRRVLTTDEAGNAVIARVHVEVGDYQIVLLPDGQLVTRRSNENRVTDRPFEPVSKNELAERLTSSTFKDFKTNLTQRYVYIYNTSDFFATATSRIIESMLRGVIRHAQAQKIEVHDPEVPLVVIMFRTEAEYLRYGRMPPGVVAFYDTMSNHVVMYEESQLAAVRRDLAIQQSISTIAHEGAHQILHNIGVQQRLSLWPMWLAEGLAEYFAPTSTDQRLTWKGAGQVNDMRMFELEEYLKSKSTDGLDGKTIQQTVIAYRLSSTGYASAWSLTHFLAKTRRAEFNKFVNRISRLGPFEGNWQVEAPGVIRAHLDDFTEHFGSDLAEMEGQLVAHLKRQPYTPPFADLLHYLAILTYPNGKTTQREANVFFSKTTAQQWLREAMAKLTDDQRNDAKGAVREFPNRALADRFRRQWLSGD